VLALLFMVAATAFLIAPTMQRRIVTVGVTDPRFLDFTNKVVGIALLPFALSLGIDHYNVFSHLFGTTAGALAGGVFFVAAIFFWFVLAAAMRPAKRRETIMADPNAKLEKLPLVDRVDHMLTEARVVLPGAQALLGFQLSVILTAAFAELPESYRIIHAAALGMVALSVILLMAPAAFHRIGFGGDETEEFYRIGSAFVIAATVPLALGIAADVFVSATTATGSARIGGLFALVTSLLLLMLWYVQPLIMRRSRRNAA
jgi:hypothetical protein